MFRQSIQSDAKLADSMPLEAHRHVKCVATEIELRLDGTVRSVGVVYTDLELSRRSPGYDANAVEQLVTRVQIFQKAHHQLVRLRTMGRQPGV
jgi:hypothetical protein